MPQLKERSKTNVTLEDLLKLKRAERPAPEFWETFDRELRRRQLASLVTVRPWYERVGQLTLVVLKRAAPVGVAAAALAAGILSVNRTRTQSEEPIYTAANEETDTAFILLPEEHIGREASQPTPSTESDSFAALWQEDDVGVHYAIRELEAPTRQPRPFVTAAAPLTLSATSDSSGEVYLMNTLTSAPAIPSAGRSESGRF